MKKSFIDEETPKHNKHENIFNITNNQEDAN